MLSKPVEKMIEPFLVDLPHVEFSPYIQSILLSHIMLSTEYSIDFLSLIPEALIIANEELFIQTLLNYTCSCPDAQTFESERFKTVFIRCIARLKSVRSLELAAKICILHANRKVWDTLVLEHKPSNLNLSDQLNRIIDENLLPRKQKIPCLSNRINSKNHLNSQDFLHVIESNGLNLEPNKNSDGKEEDDAGWSEVKNWTPLPLGCTHTFNLLTQFHLFYQNFET